VNLCKQNLLILLFLLVAYISASNASFANDFIVVPNEIIIDVRGIPDNTFLINIPINFDKTLLVLGDPKTSIDPLFATAHGTCRTFSCKPEAHGVTEEVTISANLANAVLGGILPSLPSTFTITIPIFGKKEGSSTISLGNITENSTESPDLFGASAIANINSVNVISTLPSPLPTPVTETGAPTINDQASINISSLPKTKRHIFKLLAEGTNFNSQSSCSVDASVGGLKMNVFPKIFNWSSGNHKIIIQVVIPKNLRKFLYKQAGNKVINVEVSCSNGTNGSKEVPIK